MLSAGTTYDTPTLRLFLQGTSHHLSNFMTQLLAASSKQLHRIDHILLLIVVPVRLGRSEARVQKHRPKAYPFMTKPRHEYVVQLQTT